MPRRNPRRVVHIVLCAFSRDLQPRRATARGAARYRRITRRNRATAEEADGGLFVASEGQRVIDAADRAGHETGVVPPTERCPGAQRFVEDVLKVGGLVELLIVVDPEVALRRLQQDPAGTGR